MKPNLETLKRMLPDWSWSYERSRDGCVYHGTTWSSYGARNVVIIRFGVRGGWEAIENRVATPIDVWAKIHGSNTQPGPGGA